MYYLVDSIKLELVGETPFYLGLGIKILTAILLGAIIGIDREKKLKTAGVKTQILICLGATVYVSIGQFNHLLGHTAGTVDPNRVLAQIVSGIGFLGAGAILQSRGGAIYGMTTAATIWIVAALGVAVGSGFIFSATLFAITILVVLNLVDPLIRLIQPEKHFFLEITGAHVIEKELESLLKAQDIPLLAKEVFSNDSHSKINVHLEIKAAYKDIKKITQVLKHNRHVEQFTYKSLREHHQQQLNNSGAE